jgi:hypothetical protein
VIQLSTRVRHHIVNLLLHRRFADAVEQGPQKQIAGAPSATGPFLNRWVSCRFQVQFDFRVRVVELQIRIERRCIPVFIIRFELAGRGVGRVYNK